MRNINIQKPITFLYSNNKKASPKNYHLQLTSSKKNELLKYDTLKIYTGSVLENYSVSMKITKQELDNCILYSNISIINVNRTFLPKCKHKNFTSRYKQYS